jgi:hypothetical protein
LEAHEQFRNALHSWAERLLRPYLDALGKRTRNETIKEFNDPVWGTIVLRPLEVVILDSPLLQRLRFIRQLGVVHLVYPAAHHTRLEHTIGVVSQIDRLVESINEHCEEAAPVDGDKRHLLRLTALCHDIGHGAMSHVSENALDNFAEVLEIRESFSDCIGNEEVKLSEIASYHLLGSRAFAELLANARQIVDERALPENAVELMQKAIIGERIDQKIPLLHELISGPFDADKLDYMTRDAFMSGVPVVTDMARLVQKIRAVSVTADQLPDKVAASVRKRASYVMTGISLSGGRTLDELMFGRVLLHDKLYRHHKVRAGEAMVASIFRQIAGLVPEGPSLAAFELLDHEIIELELADIERLAQRPLTSEELAAAEIAVLLAGQLKARDLFVRAFAFALDMPSDPYHSDPEHYDGLEQVVRNSDDLEFRGELMGKVAEELHRLCELLAPELIEKYGRNFKPYLWLDPPLVPPDHTDVMHAHLITDTPEGSRILPFKAGVAGASRWSDAYLLTRDIGYVFAPDDLAMYTFVACEAVFRRDYAIRIPETMVTYAKQDIEGLEACRLTLAERGFFKGLPSDLHPRPPRLLNADIGRRVLAVLQTLQGYEGPRTNRRDKGPPLLSEQRIIDWLKQFGGEFDDEPLKLLEELRLVGREQILAALTSFMDTHEDAFAGAAICPLGTAKDSSAVTTYYANDLRGHRGAEVMSLGTALTTERPIIFIDDFVGTGQQSVSILEEWFDVTPSTALGETRDGPLSEGSREALRCRPLGLVFAQGGSGGVQPLEGAVERLGLEAEVFLADDQAPRAFGAEISKPRKELMEYCREVGLALLADGERRHTKKWREERALGYGNDAFLVSFPYNTPTQTLTCLWKSGKVADVDWLALLPHRKKV